MRKTFPVGGHGLYDRLVAKRIQPFYDTLLPHFAGAERIVDIGCGPGRFASAIASAHAAHVTGFDIDARQIRRASRHATWNLDFEVADAVDLPLPAGSVDVALTSESLHHWGDRLAGLQEMRRVLRPAGRAVIVEACGDITRDELRSWYGRVPPGMTAFVRWIFQSHGFTTEALESDLVPLVDDAFGGHKVTRRQGWWIVEAQSAPFS